MASPTPPLTSPLPLSLQQRTLHGLSATPLAFAPTSPSRQHPSYGGAAPAASARISPRQVKLQRVEPPACTLRLPLRDHVAANFHHELFQFHQTLRDAVAKCEHDDSSRTPKPSPLPHTAAKHAASGSSAGASPPPSAPLVRFDRSVLELLTSDRGDAVLKEFFRQWHRTTNTGGATRHDTDYDEQQGMQDVLWDVFETFFKSVPLVLPESEVGNSKSYYRYLDALRSLRDVLFALLFKRPSAEQHSGDDDDDPGVNSAGEIVLGANGRSLSLLLSSKASSLSASVPLRQPQQPQTKLLPMYVYCRQLERELNKLRERHPSRSRIAGYRASIKCSERQEVGLLNDATVLLLLDFWELPRTERLGFFCQVASQTCDDDAAMVLRVFLDSCSTRNFLQLWDALQQAPQFESTFSAAARQYCAALQQSASSDASSLSESTSSASGAAEGDGGSDTASKRRGSERHRRTSRAARQSLSLRSNSPGRHRPSRFVDLNGLTEVFEERDDDDGNAHEYGDSDSDSDRDSDGSKRRFHKILIRERGRTPPDERHTSPHKTHRRRRHQHSSRHDSRSNPPGSPPASGKSTVTTAAASPPYQLPPVNPHASLIQRLHDDLVEVIKQDELSMSSNHVAPPLVMDSVWKLLELLDKGKSASGSFHRHATGGVASRQSSVSGFDTIDRSNGPVGPSRASSIRQDALSSSQQPPRQALLLDANLTRDQQFVIKLDQLQSLLTALGAFSLHEMATDTISSVYRRMPALAQLFSSVHDKTYEAAGMNAPTTARTGASGFHSDSGSPAQNQHSHPHMHHHASMPSASWQQQHRMPSSMLPPASSGSPDDQVIEAASLLMAKVSKIVRSLANLDQLSVASSNGSDGKSASLDVLALLKLADEMEIAETAAPVTEAAANRPNEPSASGNGRRVSMLDHSRRLAILHKLKMLAASNEIDAVAAMVADTVKDVQEQHVQQREQIEKLSSAVSAKPRRPHRRAPLDVLLDTEDDASDDDDGADEVLKMAKKAKTRRASAAKAQQQQSQAASSDPAGSDNDDDDNDGDDSSRLRSGRRDVLLPFRQTNGPQKGIKLFSVGILLRIIYQVYREHYEGMVASLQYGSRRMEFSEFLYDWHIRKYGLKTLAQQHLLKLIQSLRKFEKKTLQCQLCLRFLGIQSPLGYHEHKFVLSLLDKWSLGTFAGATKHRVEHTPRQFKLRLAFALSSLQDALTERFGVYFRSMDTVASRVRAHAMTSPGDEDFVKETDVLRIAIDEWVLQRQRLEQILEAVYVAGDVNGDGGLEYDEFAAVVAHLSPIADDKLLQKVFAAAHDVVKPPRRISFERFLDVILLEKLFHAPSSSSTGSGTAVRSSAASGSGAGAAKPAILGDDSSSRSNPSTSTRAGASGGAGGASGSSALATLEDEEAYQFDLLQQTWEHDRDVVTNALKLITHQQTAASLTFRVAFLTQILLKRVDSKTAWMCHKQIMREISRYQNLNEEQIVVLKTKEETFRKAVLAITHLRKVGALLGTSSSSITASLSEAHVHTDTDSTTTTTQDALTVRGASESAPHKYTAAVEQTLEGLERRPSTQDMAALEDELRETFLAQADTAAIDDFKSALQQLRRMSLHNGSLSHEQLATLLAPALPLRIERLDEDDGEDDDGGEDDGDDDGEDEDDEETGGTGEEATAE